MIDFPILVSQEIRHALKEASIFLLLGRAPAGVAVLVPAGLGRLAHFPVKSHQPAPPPDHPKRGIDGWLGGERAGAAGPRKRKMLLVAVR